MKYTQKHKNKQNININVLKHSKQKTIKNARKTKSLRNILLGNNVPLLGNTLLGNNVPLLGNTLLGNNGTLLGNTNTNTYTNTYYIIDCIGDVNNELKFDALEPYLKTLKLKPDKMMPIIREQDLLFIKKNNISPLKYCNTNIYFLPKLYKLINENVHPQFMWYNINSPHLNSRFYNIKCNMINVVNSVKLLTISDKNALYNNMEQYCPDICSKHMAKTFKINEITKYKNLKGLETDEHKANDYKANEHKTDEHKTDKKQTKNSYYILRPVNSTSGQGILYVSSKDELTEAIEYYKKTANYRGINYGNNVIASEYIINPLLFKGYKFHLRMYYLISYINGEFNSFFYDNYGKILTANSPYNIRKPFKKDVHDSHAKYSNINYSFPKDFNRYTIGDNFVSPNHILKQMQDILKGVSIILKKSKGEWLFENQQHGFQILGIDFMIDANGCVFLIECNSALGFGYTKTNNDPFIHILSKSIFKWINETILEPYYKKTDAKQHPTYLQNTYYIIDCIGNDNNALQFNALEVYLKNLDLKPDNMMPKIRELDLLFIKKNNITPFAYCNTNVHLPALPNNISNNLHPQFMWYNINSPALNIRFFKPDAYLINIINRDKLKMIFDKYKLYTVLMQLFSTIIKKHLPDTFLINELHKYNFVNIKKSSNKSSKKSSKKFSNKLSYYILKPIDSFGGKDILYISDKSQLDNAIEYYKNTRNYKNHLYGTDVIAQTYIMNPLLYNNKKCHLRVQYLVTYIHQVFHSFVLTDSIRILTAKEKYTIDLPFNKDVHDTHIKSSGDDFFLDEHYTNFNMPMNEQMNKSMTIKQKNKIINDICKITKLISKILLSDDNSKYKWLYDNQEHGFNSMGIDFMIDDKLNIFLIECNENPSFVFHKIENNKMFSSKYFSWINDTVLEPCYKKTDATKHYTYLHL